MQPAAEKKSGHFKNVQSSIGSHIFNNIHPKYIDIKQSCRCGSQDRNFCQVLILVESQTESGAYVDFSSVSYEETHRNVQLYQNHLKIKIISLLKDTTSSYVKSKIECVSKEESLLPWNPFPHIRRLLLALF